MCRHVLHQPACCTRSPCLHTHSPCTLPSLRYQAFLLIFFSELGDKTFFIALLLALQQPKGTVFAGTFGALAVMSAISAALGRALHLADEALPAALHSDVPWDDYAAVALLLFFGIRTLAAAGGADEAAEEERGDAQTAVAGLASGGQTAAVLASTFALVFAAEWGDKSFLATIALSAASDPVGVTLGACAGHATATALAVAGGSLLGGYVSERVVSYVGGSLFILFAAATAVDLVIHSAG